MLGGVDRRYILVCEQCNKVFPVSVHNAIEGRRFCSQKCYHDYAHAHPLTEKQMRARVENGLKYRGKKVHGESFKKRTSERMRGRNNSIFKRKRWRYVHDGVTMRSMLEVRCAEPLKELHEDISYEPITFDLLVGSVKTSYTPDFVSRTSKIAYEVKGLLREGYSLEKMKEFRRSYPEWKLVLVSNLSLRNKVDESCYDSWIDTGSLLSRHKLATKCFSGAPLVGEVTGE